MSALILLFLGYIISILGREDSIYLADDGGRLGDYLNLIISIFIILYVYRYHIVTLDKDRLLFWGAILSVSMCFLALYIPILTRVAVYFRLYSIVLFANVIKDRQSFGYRTIEKPIIFLIFILYTYCLYAKPEWNRAYPYFFFWESDLPFKLPNVFVHSIISIKHFLYGQMILIWRIVLMMS